MIDPRSDVSNADLRVTAALSAPALFAVLCPRGTSRGALRYPRHESRRVSNVKRSTLLPMPNSLPRSFRASAATLSTILTGFRVPRCSRSPAASYASTHSFRPARVAPFRPDLCHASAVDLNAQKIPRRTPVRKKTDSEKKDRKRGRIIGRRYSRAVLSPDKRTRVRHRHAGISPE